MIYPLNKGGSFHSFWYDQLGYITSSMVDPSESFESLVVAIEPRNDSFPNMGWMTINNQQTALHKKKTNNPIKSLNHKRYKRLKPTSTIPSRRYVAGKPPVVRIRRFRAFHPRDGARCLSPCGGRPLENT